MYRKKSPQMTIDDFFLPFGGKLDANNRWVKYAAIIPWDRIRFFGLWFKELNPIVVQNHIQVIQLNGVQCSWKTAKNKLMVILTRKKGANVNARNRYT